MIVRKVFLVFNSNADRDAFAKEHEQSVESSSLVRSRLTGQFEDVVLEKEKEQYPDLEVRENFQMGPFLN